MRRTALLPLLSLVACTVEPPTAAPTVAARSLRTPQAAVLPQSAYVMRQLFPGRASTAYDINNKMQVVGSLKVYAYVHDLPSGQTVLLPSGSASSAAAYAINTYGAAGGFVARTTHTPAVWVTPSTLTTLKANGEVFDLNDRNESVGWMLNSRGQQQGLYWDVNAGRSYLLPFPRGATWARAHAINNDRVIVGESDLGGVMWTGAPGAFTATRLKSIRPFDIDHGNGTVGDNGNAALPNALYGDPDSTGTFGWSASAQAVNGVGIAAGDAYQFFNPWDAFVADRFGNVTILPVVQGLFPARARGINDCGAVAGFVMLTSVFEAVVWDPGC